jgi:hypothetical protein
MNVNVSELTGNFMTNPPAAIILTGRRSADDPTSSGDGRDALGQSERGGQSG